MVPYWFAFACSLLYSILVSWDLYRVGRENLDLRLQNERLIARIAHEYHFAAARPGPPPSIPDTPTPAPMWSNRPRIRPYVPSPLPPSER